MKLARQALDLVCIAPVHVGNGTTLKAYEYLFDKRRKEVFFLREPAWISFLAKHGLTDDFAQYIEDTARKLNGKGNFKGLYLWDYLHTKRIAEREIRALAIRRAQVLVEKDKGSANDIALQAALADGRPYIPGSAVKGALRTGLLYRYLKQHEAVRERYWNELLRKVQWEKDKEIDRTCSAVIQSLETEAFHCLGANPKSRDDAVNSVLRGLRISDAAVPEKEKDTVILQKTDATQKTSRDGRQTRTISLFRECIPAGRRLRFSITADFSMLEKIGISSIAEIVQWTRAYTQDGLSWQRKFFDGAYGYVFDEAEEADLLLGGGTGFLSKTIVRALAPSEEAARDFTARLLDKKFTKRDKKTGKWVPDHKHVIQDGALSPRTLKLAAYGQDTWALGLCRLEEAKGC